MRNFCILAADSRARWFRDIDQTWQRDMFTVDHDSYIPIYISIPGAKILDLLQPILTKLSELPTRSRILLKIAAGINNLTKKYHHRRRTQLSRAGRAYYEIAPSHYTADHIIYHLSVLKYHIKRAYPKVIVSYITIPPADFDGHYNYQQRKALGTKQIFTQEEREIHQRIHLDEIEHINQRINSENTSRQQGIKPQTVSWHTKIIKRKTNGTRYLWYNLYDGLHGTVGANKYLHRQLHTAYVKEIRSAIALEY